MQQQQIGKEKTKMNERKQVTNAAKSINEEKFLTSK